MSLQLAIFFIPGSYWQFGNEPYSVMTHQYRQLAKDRLAVLWQYYNENSNIILIADVKRLTGCQYDQLYRSFNYHNLTAPVVYDSQREKIRRKVEKLRLASQELKQSYLTLEQAKDILKTRKMADVRNAIIQIKKHGFSCPEIRMEKIETDETNDIDFFRMHGSVDYKNYPSGLLVMDYWYGPGENETTYLLK